MTTPQPTPKEAEERAREYAQSKCRAKGNPNTCDKSYYEDIDAFLAGAQSERELHRWVACSERLPEAGVPVLVFSTHDGIEVDCLFKEGRGWDACIDVTHWQPLPKPPENSR